jgi:hypothetical protein
MLHSLYPWCSDGSKSENSMRWEEVWRQMVSTIKLGPCTPVRQYRRSTSNRPETRRAGDQRVWQRRLIRCKIAESPPGRVRGRLRDFGVFLASGCELCLRCYSTGRSSPYSCRGACYSLSTFAAEVDPGMRRHRIPRIIPLQATGQRGKAITHSNRHGARTKWHAWCAMRHSNGTAIVGAVACLCYPGLEEISR